MSRLTKTDAVARLGAMTAIVATDADGRGLELSPTWVTGTRLVAHTDRLRLASASRLTVRLHDASGRPWLLGLEVESAEFIDPTTASVTLHAVSLRLDQAHRKADRMSLNGHARLTAINCQNVVDGDLVEGSIIDIAEGGVALLTERLLRPGDRLTLDARFFATRFQAEVRVARVVERRGKVEAGCRFLSVTAEQRRTIRDLMTYREPSKPDDTGINWLRELAASDDQLTTKRESIWRRAFRRSA